MIVYVRKDEKTGARIILIPREIATMLGNDRYWMNRGFAVDGNQYLRFVTTDKLLEAEKDLIEVFGEHLEFA